MAASSEYQISLLPDDNPNENGLLPSKSTSLFLEYDTPMYHSPLPTSSTEDSGFVLSVDTSNSITLEQDLFGTFVSPHGDPLSTPPSYEINQVDEYQTSQPLVNDICFIATAEVSDELSADTVNHPRPLEDNSPYQQLQDVSYDVQEFEDANNISIQENWHEIMTFLATNMDANHLNFADQVSIFEWTINDAENLPLPLQPYLVHFQIGFTDHSVHDLLINCPLQDFWVTTSFGMPIEAPREASAGWYRLGLSTPHEEAVFQEWQELPISQAPLLSSVDLTVAGTHTTLHARWRWPWPCTTPEFFIDFKLHEESEWCRIAGFDLEATIEDLRSNRWYQVRLGVTSITLNTSTKSLGVVWANYNTPSLSIILNQVVVCTAPATFELDTIAGFVWIHVPELPPTYVADVETELVVEGTEVTTQQVVQRFTAIKLASEQVNSVRITRKLGASFQAISPWVKARASCDSFSFTTMIWPLLAWNPVPPWLQSHLQVKVESFNSDLKWISLDTTVERSICLDELALNESCQLLRLAAHVPNGEQCINQSSPLIVAHRIHTNILGLGNRIDIVFKYPVPPQLLSLIRPPYFELHIDGEVVHTLPYSQLDEMKFEWTFHDSSQHSIAIAPSFSLSGDIGLVSEDMAVVKYVPTWPRVDLNLGVITHDLATCQLAVGQWIGPTIQFQLEIELNGIWNLRWFKLLSSEAADASDSISGQTHTIQIKQVPSHSLIPIRITCRLASDHPWECVVQTQLITACDTFDIHPTEEGGFSLAWEAPCHQPLSYAIQLYNPATLVFETWVTVHDITTVVTPPLNKPLHLFYLRIQTHSDTQIPLDGVAQVALTNPAAPTLAEVFPTHGIMLYKNINRTMLPEDLKQKDLEASVVDFQMEFKTDLSHAAPTTDFKVLGRCVIRQLQPHTQYRARLWCSYKSNTNNLKCVSCWCILETSKSFPDVPGNVLAEEISLPLIGTQPSTLPSACVLVNWDVPKDNGEPIMGYAVEMAWSTDKNPLTWDWQGVYIGLNDSFCPTVEQLKLMRKPKQTIVAFRVQAGNSLGWSSFAISNQLACIGLGDEVEALRLDETLPSQNLVKHTQLSKPGTRIILPRIPQLSISPAKKYLESRQLNLSQQVYQAERLRWYLDFTEATTPTTSQLACNIYSTKKSKRKPKLR